MSYNGEDRGMELVDYEVVKSLRNLTSSYMNGKSIRVSNSLLQKLNNLTPILGLTITYPIIIVLNLGI